MSHTWNVTSSEPEAQEPLSDEDGPAVTDVPSTEPESDDQSAPPAESRDEAQAKGFTRVARPARVALACVLVGALLVLSFILGGIFAPAAKPAQDAGEPIPVWAAVKEQPVVETVELSGMIESGTTAEIRLPGFPAPAIVVRTPLKVGQQIGPGQLLTVVSDKPIFLLPAPLALYRDLRVGDSGDDVRTLQASLNALGYEVGNDGVVGQGTLRAVASVFDAEGFSLPTEQVPVEPAPGQTQAPQPQIRSYIPFQQLATVAGNGGIVSSSAGLGTDIAQNPVIVSLVTSAPFASASVDAGHADLAKAGQPVTVRTSAGEMAGKVTTVGEFKVGEGGQPSGYPIRVDVAPADAAKLPAGQSAVVILGGDSASKPELAVPLIAVRNDTQGSYVLVRNGSNEPRRVTVTVIRIGNGMAAVSGDLKPGDEVQVA